MFTVRIQNDKTLLITASNEGRAWIKDNHARGYWFCMADIFEAYSCNGSFTHFDAGAANPFVGLTAAPCVAESIDYSDGSGTLMVQGRLWTFSNYMIENDLETLKNKGRLVYTNV